VDPLLIALVTALASFAGSWGAMKITLRQLQRDMARAHQRLDLIGAPNVTLGAE
jgi:hypothetical protein